MINKPIYIPYVILILAYFPLMAQPSYIFEGGDGSGYTSATIMTSDDMLFRGGASDGYAQNTIAETNNILYKGGENDGYNSLVLTSLSTLLYTGGDGDGYVNNTHVVNNKPLYKGGDNDGYSMTELYELFIWTGAIGTGWDVSGNWNYNLVPTIHRPVSIPSGVPNWPKLNGGILAIHRDPLNLATYTCSKLRIEDMAEMTTKVNTFIENYGELRIKGLFLVKNSTINAFQNFPQGIIIIKSNGELRFQP